MRPKNLPYLLSALLFACDPGPSDDVACVSEGLVRVTVHAPPPGVPLVGDLTLTGLAEHSEGLTIRTLSLLGEPVENTGFNFDHWKVTLPATTLMGAASEGLTADGRAVALTALAREACGGALEQALFVLADESEVESVTIYLEPQVRLGTLRAAITYDDGTEQPPEYLAPTAGAAATLTVSSDPSAAGAKVRLEGLGVLLDGIVDRAEVRLDDEGVAKIELRKGNPGQASITARAGDDLTGAVLLVGGRPVLTPGALTLAPGGAAAVHGRVEGDVPARVTCTASAAMFASVTSTKGALTQPGGVTFDVGAGESIDFVVASSAEAKPEVVTITCTELAYGQVSETLVVSLQGA